MTPAQVAHIMELVDQYAATRNAGYIGSFGTPAEARAAVEAALRDAPQQAEGLCDRICEAIKAADDKSTDEAGYMLDSNDCIAIVRRLLAAAPTEAKPAQQDAVDATITLDKEELAQLIASMLYGTYHCTRVWEAWNVGTMSRYDFEPVDESDTPYEIADAIRAAISAKKGQP